MTADKKQTARVAEGNEDNMVLIPCCYITLDTRRYGPKQVLRTFS